MLLTAFTMSLPSVDSLGTNYGSCQGSDRDSLISSETFKSVQSESTVFLSGGSDTDTLINDDDSEDTIDTFYDVVDVTVDADINVHHSQLVSVLTALEFRSSTPVPVSGGSPASSERDRLLGGDQEHLDSGDCTSSRNSSAQTVIDNTGTTGSSVSGYQAIVTRIPTRFYCQTSTSTPSSRTSKWTVPCHIFILIGCSLGFQTALRFNPNLNCWTLTFWRSVLQVFSCLFGLCWSNQFVFGLYGHRFKLLSHCLISSFSVFCLLYSSERLVAENLASIFLIMPIGPMVLELLLRRGSLRAHYGLFVMLVWIWSVLLLSHNIPWPALPLSNKTNNTNEKNDTRNSNWKPPIFALDNVHLWPVQPSIYSLETNATEIGTTFFDESQKISGLTVGILGLLASSLLPVISTSCPRDTVWSILFWQAIGASFVAVTGVKLHGETYLFSTWLEWTFVGLISLLGLIGNLCMLRILTLKQDKTRNGWSDQTRFTAAVTIGVVSRSAFEILAVCAINFSCFSLEPILIEDGLGMALLVAIALFCCFVKPVGSSLSIPAQSTGCV